MGQAAQGTLSNLKSKKRDYRILMVGLDAAGKTTILYQLKLGKVQETIPTIGFNVEEVNYHNIKFTVWDVGGQDKIRPLWKHYYPTAHGLIFVVDSADKGRFEDAKKALDTMIQERIEDGKTASVLIYANKQDQAGAAQPAEVVQALGLMNCGANIHWNVQTCSALTGAGLTEGLDWLSKDMAEHVQDEPEAESCKFDLLLLFVL